MQKSFQLPFLYCTNGKQAIMILCWFFKLCKHKLMIIKCLKLETFWYAIQSIMFDRTYPFYFI